LPYGFVVLLDVAVLNVFVEEGVCCVADGHYGSRVVGVQGHPNKTDS
jgi:hypothetical protein